MLKTALVIDNRQGRQFFRFFQRCSNMELVGLVCPDCNIDWLPEKERKSLYVTSDLDKMAAFPELEAVIDTTGNPEVRAYLKKILPERIKLETLTADSVLHAVIGSAEQLSETHLLKSELKVILDAVPDAIEVADGEGIIRYINPAFTRVTGLTEKQRVNRNIFEVSPHGALAKSLIKQQQVTGFRTQVGGSDADVISNASPIFVDKELIGAVVVFQPVDDILKLMDQLDRSHTIIDNLYTQLERVSGSQGSFDMLIGQSRLFKAALETARQAARSESNVLITGESGSGKSLFARAIHNSSNRKKKPLIIIDCSTVPDTLQELEFFGCEKGALSGVTRTRLGKVELAEGSTLFVKEINSLNPFLQEQLLKVLTENRFYRIGSENPIQSDIRIIASSNDNLKAALLKGSLAEELYQNLAQVQIKLPPLRKRLDDLPLLVENFIEHLNRKLGKQVRQIAPRALQEMHEYDWPGNINELKSAVERSMVVADGSVIEYHHLAPYIGRLGSYEVPDFDTIMPLDKMEQIMLKLALTRYGESLEGKKKAAQALNISLATLYNKLKRYGS